MEWYYLDGDSRLGPVPRQQLDVLAAEGTINDSTLVWHEGKEDWVPYGNADSESSSPPPGASGQVSCAECGQSFSLDDVIEYRGLHVCGPCKPVFLQRVKEGGALPSEVVYGGFWIRFAAKFIDGIITGLFTTVVMLPAGAFATSEDIGVIIAVFLVYYAIALAIPLIYTTFLVGKYGATLGKMAAGLRVVRPDGEPLTYLRAFGRYFAEMVSAFTFMIGYIMAAFDDEKRALHDRISDTRVIRTR